MYNIVKYKRSRLSQLGIQQHIPERVDQSVANARINRLGCFVHFLSPAPSFRPQKNVVAYDRLYVLILLYATPSLYNSQPDAPEDGNFGFATEF
jgi:hypothetical protein